MTKLRKQRRRKRFNRNINRKRYRNKVLGVGKAKCLEVEKAWDKNRSLKSNLTEMGLVYDLNESLKRSNTRQDVYKKMMSLKTEDKWVEETLSQEQQPSKPSKLYVVEQLEKEAKAPREKRFQLPNGQVEFITYLLDKYGHDYKAMARDKKNYYQQTWKQLRAKIKSFMRIPEQYSQYLAARNLLDKEDDEKVAAALVDEDDSD